MTESPGANGELLDVEQAVRDRYSAASQQVEPQLCCAVSYNADLLKVLPQELIDRDYGCGDPSRYVQRGETVLDLGSGGGKICYIASQVVGPEGAVHGVDMNDEMLSLARTHQADISQRIGWDNVEFHKGRIQDLGLDLEQLEARLQQQPVATAAAWLQSQSTAAELRRKQPMIASDSIDVVISNCVLNLVSPEDRRQMFAEIFRVLKRGGRAVISDIVSDEPVPDALRQNAELWSGCISGAFLERELLQAFEEAGFYGVEIVERQAEPWMVVEGIEFRSMSVRAFKGKQGPCDDHHQAVIYKGPWKRVTDDDGHVLERGAPMAVCDKTFQIYSRPPYAGQIIPVPPSRPIDPAAALPFDCRTGELRDPQQTKAGKQEPQPGDKKQNAQKPGGLNLLPGDCCGPQDGCC
ncbi:methyltransferase domain-containing protein [Lignipirellula cremea]|uniref:Arsenite methyltransferase n=1 Tax=Lignipirellula cremea TaxID=2528010 RepID=A0A518E128_9BACT|nr:methyltransferase domain-containing protein [Lignipirellula cremea]QDU97799.1 arsenite S-adenosylmethyltransferase [Lignipirellula cremea]